MPDKMEQQIQTKDMCKGGESYPDILERVKKYLIRNEWNEIPNHIITSSINTIHIH